MQITKTLDQLEKEISEAKRGGVMSFLRIGRALSDIQEGNLWRPVAATFELYVESALGFKRSWAYSLIGTWHTFGPHLIDNADLQRVDITRLVKLLPMVNEQNKEELLAMAAHVPDTRGFEDNLRNLQGKHGTDDPHDHDWSTVEWKICKICGKKERV